jgi:fatty acid desaturase
MASKWPPFADGVIPSRRTLHGGEPTGRGVTPRPVSFSQWQLQRLTLALASSGTSSVQTAHFVFRMIVSGKRVQNDEPTLFAKTEGAHGHLRRWLVSFAKEGRPLDKTIDPVATVRSTGRGERMRHVARTRFADDVNRELLQLRKLDNHHAVLAVVTDYLMIAGASLLFMMWPWSAPVALLVIGSRQRALQTLLHESAHGTLARNRALNYLLGTVFSGFLVFQTYRSYVASHVRSHHGSLGDPVADPDTFQYVSAGLADRDFTRQDLVREIFRTLLLHNVPNYLTYLLRERLAPRNWDSLNPAYRLEFAAFLTVWGVVIGGAAYLGYLTELALLWFLPFLTVNQVLGWFIEIAEHYPIVLDAARDLDMTRNRRSGPIERFLTGAHGEQLHLTHHLRPHIPFWNIEAAHKVMLKDNRYADINRYTSGIFSSIDKSVPTILEEIIHLLPDARSLYRNSGTTP